MKNTGIHTESLKEAILAQYKSVRQFSGVMGIPYSTLVTALERGVDGMISNFPDMACRVEKEMLGE